VLLGMATSYPVILVAAGAIGLGSAIFHPEASRVAIEGVTCMEPEGAFYGFPNLSAYLDRSIRGRTAATTTELAAILLDEAKVAIVPGEAFDAPGYARLSFALGDDDLGEGCRRIADLLAEAS
jgi:aspartate/methionine/tyrosine aminotransferase